MNHESQEQNKRLQCAEQNKPAAINKRDHQNTANFQDVNQRLKVWQGKGKKIKTTGTPKKEYINFRHLCIDLLFSNYDSYRIAFFEARKANPSCENTATVER